MGSTGKDTCPDDFLDDYLNSHSARIKNVYIELPEYEFYHSPSGIHRKDKRIIGRGKVFERLRTILRKSKSRSGAYLITGYRGMGKTSLIRRVIADQQEDTKGSRWWLTLATGIILAFVLLNFIHMVDILLEPIRSPNIWKDEIDPYPRLNRGFQWILGETMLLGMPWWLLAVILAAGHGIMMLIVWEGYHRKWHIPFGRKKEHSLERWERFWIYVFPRGKKLWPLDIEISLSHDSIRELDFLRLLAKKMAQVYGEFVAPGFSYFKTLRALLKYLLVAIGLIILYMRLDRYFFCIPEETIIRNYSLFFDTYFRPLVASIYFLISIGIVLFAKRYFFRFLDRLGIRSHFVILEKLLSLESRIDAKLTSEAHQSTTASAPKIGSFHRSKRHKREFPIARSKEVEFELINILDDLDKLDPLATQNRRRTSRKRCTI